MIVSTESQKVMDNCFKAIGGDLNKLLSGRVINSMGDYMPLASAELIGVHFAGMDEVTRKRALRTLKQIGG